MAVEPAVRLVIVHGVGTGKAGQALREWSSGIYAWLQRAVPVQVRLDSASLAGGDSPEVVLTITDADTSRVIRIQEAYWGDAVPEAGPLKVLYWLATVAPTITVAEAVLALRRVRGVWAAPAGLGHKVAVTAAQGMWAATSLVPFVAILIALVVAAPVVVIIVAALALLSAVPVESLKVYVTKLLGWLSATIGDAFLFTADPVARQAMLDVVRKGMTDPDDSTPVVVVAHSQGAALAYHALAGIDVARRPKEVIAVGSALGRLQTAFPKAWPVCVPLLSGFSLALFVASGVLWQHASSTWGFAALAAAAACLIRLGTMVNDRLEDASGLAPPPLPWLDLWLGGDPVPNGPITSSSTYRWWHLRGELSVLGDHGRGSADRAGVLPLVIDAADRATRAPGGSSPRLLHAHLRLGQRPSQAWITWPALVITWLRWAIVGAAVVTLWHSSLFSWGHWFLRAPPSVIREPLQAVITPLSAALEDLQDVWPRQPLAETLLGAAIVIGVGLLLAAVVRRLQTIVHRWRVGRWLAKPSQEPPGLRVTSRAGWCATGVAAVIIFLAGAVLHAAWPFEPGHPPWSASDAADAFVAAAANGRADRLADVLSEGAATQLLEAYPSERDPGDQAAAQRYIVTLCSDAQEGLGGANTAVEGSEVTTRFVPEPIPTCEGVEGFALLVPSTVSERSWRQPAQVTGLCVIGSTPPEDLIRARIGPCTR